MAAQMKELFEGKWTVYKSENFEAYLDKIDVGFLKKKMASTVTPTMTVSVSGETITASISAGPKTNTNTFTLGTSFDFEAEMSGTAVASFTDGKWVMEVTPKDTKKGKPQIVTREIINGDIVQTMTVDGVVAKRFFKKA